MLVINAISTWSTWHNSIVTLTAALRISPRSDMYNDKSESLFRTYHKLSFIFMLNVMVTTELIAWLCVSYTQTFQPMSFNFNSDYSYVSWNLVIKEVKSLEKMQNIINNTSNMLEMSALKIEIRKCLENCAWYRLNCIYMASSSYREVLRWPEVIKRYPKLHITHESIAANIIIKNC
jgi:hypothetical protein